MRKVTSTSISHYIGAYNVTLVEMCSQFRKKLQEENNVDNSSASKWKLLNGNKNGPIPHFVLHDDLIFSVDPYDDRMRLVTPRKFKKEVFAIIHTECSGFSQSFERFHADIYVNNMVQCLRRCIFPRPECQRVQKKTPST